MNFIGADVYDFYNYKSRALSAGLPKKDTNYGNPECHA
jgi:hypothetical protein